MRRNDRQGIRNLPRFAPLPPIHPTSAKVSSPRAKLEGSYFDIRKSTTKAGNHFQNAPPADDSSSTQRPKRSRTFSGVGSPLLNSSSITSASHRLALFSWMAPVPGAM